MRLKDIGLDKSLAVDCQRIGAMPETEIEKAMGKLIAFG